MSKQTDIPEAIASVTYTITTGTGFNCLFTVRDVSGIGLLNKMPAIESKFAEQGIKPQAPKNYGGFQKKEKVFVDGKKCPKCDSRLEEKETKMGRKFHKCEKGIYNFQTKQNEGCDYVDWLNPDASEFPMTAEEYDKRTTNE